MGREESREALKAIVGDVGLMKFVAGVGAGLGFLNRGLSDRWIKEGYRNYSHRLLYIMII